MLITYNCLRALARGLAAGAVGVVVTGKAEPFGAHFDGTQAVLLAAVLLCLAVAAFTLESMSKQRAGV